MHIFNVNTSQEAWEKLNEWLFQKEGYLTKMGQGRNGNVILAHDVFVEIRKAWVDPGFDFAKVFHYRRAKWTSLVKNYVDLNYLDLIKAEIETRELKKQQQYSVAFRFVNSHDSGKDCLVSLLFCRRLNSDIPHLVFHTRATEVTKRLLWDFLLVQRIGEYVYGEKATFTIGYYAPLVFITNEAFTMYHVHRDIPSLIKPGKDPLKFQQKTLDLIQKFKTIDPESLTYKVHRRSVRSLQGITRDGEKHELKARSCNLSEFKIDYPDGVLTESQRKNYRKQLSKSKAI